MSERTIRRWTEQGIIQATPTPDVKDFTYDFHALTQFRRVRELRAQGQSIRQIEAELQGQLNLFRGEVGRLARLLTPFEEALLLHEQGDPKAADCYLEAINEGDNVAEAYCNLAIINLEQQNLAKALDNFTLSLKSDPRHVEAHYNLGNLYYDAGDLGLAHCTTKRPRRLNRAFLSFTSISPSSITSWATVRQPQPRSRGTCNSSPMMKRLTH